MIDAAARPSFVAKAFAHALFAAGLAAGFSMRTGVGVLAFVSALAFVCFWWAARVGPAQRQASIPVTRAVGSERGDP